MYSSLLSPGERDADHPMRGSLFPAFAADANPQRHHQRMAWAGGVLLIAATAVLLALR